MSEWKVVRSVVGYYVFRQTRELEKGELMDSEIWERRGDFFATQEEAQKYADELNGV